MQHRDVDRDAPVLVKCQRVVSAPIERLWRMHTDVNAWPGWQADISQAVLSGAFAPGASFTWRTAGLDAPITSTIYAVEPGRRTLWGGAALGIEGLHAWIFEPHENGVEITTEESFRGGPADIAPKDTEAQLAASLERWLSFFADATSGTP